MLVAKYDLMLTAYEEKKNKEGKAYYIIRVLTNDGKSLDIFSNEPFDGLKKHSFYTFEISISVGAKTYVNIVSITPVKA